MAQAAALATLVPEGVLVADLGSGGGLPGLVLAERHPAVVLIEASQRRADHLRWAVQRLGWGNRVRVEGRPAEEVGRDPGLRGTFGAVTARSLGAPATTAELAAPLLAVGGVLLVTEPPTPDPDRWSPLRPPDGAGLEAIPLQFEDLVTTPHGHVARLRMTSPCPDRLPRSVGAAARRPRW